MILYGRNPVREALRGRRAHTVGEVWATKGAVREPWLSAVAVRASTGEEIERRCASPAHQGICVEVGSYPYISAAELLAVSEPLIVALDQVQDPQNLGSICRTAECAGVTGVVIPERRAAEITPAVCKASAGAVEHLRVARVRNMADFLREARDAGCWCYGASAPEDLGTEALAERGGPVQGSRPVKRRGEAGLGRATERGDAAGSSRATERSDAARSGGATERSGALGSGRATERSGASKATPSLAYDEPDYRGGVVLALGSEGEGLRPRVAASCDALISLPLLGRIESLGVSAAAAAVLYEIVQNRNRGLDNAP